MSKTLLYRLFKAGEIPKEHRDIIEREGILISDEGIGGSITVKNYRAPGRYSALRKNWFSGSVALTQFHMLCFAYSRTMVGLPWKELAAKDLEFYIEKNDVLCIRYDASTFSEKASGETVLRYRTELAGEMLKMIKEKQLNTRP